MYIVFDNASTKYHFHTCISSYEECTRGIQARFKMNLSPHKHHGAPVPHDSKIYWIQYMCLHVYSCIYIEGWCSVSMETPPSWMKGFINNVVCMLKTCHSNQIARTNFGRTIQFLVQLNHLKASIYKLYNSSLRFHFPNTVSEFMYTP